MAKRLRFDVLYSTLCALQIIVLYCIVFKKYIKVIKSMPSVKNSNKEQEAAEFKTETTDL